MRLHLILTALLVTSVVATTPATAVPFDFTETSDIVEASLGALDVGINTASGSLSGFDYDSINFSLTDGLQIDSIELIISEHVDSRIGPTNISYLLERPVFLSGGLEGNGLAELLSAPYAAPGNLLLSVEHSLFIPDSFSRWRWNIAVSETAVVPEPTSMALLGLGGLVLAGSRRRTLHRVST
ncbi:MAG: PEP-CTERM sorting domain-containing protein [Pseudomonadota bacterium]